MDPAILVHMGGARLDTQFRREGMIPARNQIDGILRRRLGENISIGQMEFFDIFFRFCRSYTAENLLKRIGHLVLRFRSICFHVVRLRLAVNRICVNFIPLAQLIHRSKCFGQSALPRNDLTLRKRSVLDRPSHDMP